MRKPIALRLLLFTQALATAFFASGAKAEVLNLAEHAVCITASRAGQTFSRSVDCGDDATRCVMTEGEWNTPGFFGVELKIHPLQAEYVLVRMDALGGVVIKDGYGNRITTTAATLTSSTGFEAHMAESGWAAGAGEYDGTAVFRLVPKGASCETPTAAPAAAAAADAPAAGQSWSDWFWSWFE